MRYSPTEKKRRSGGRGRKLRYMLWELHKGICFFCKIETVMPKRPNDGRQENNWATIDHLVELGEGGTNQKKNMVLACYACNQVRNHEYNKSKDGKSNG